MIKKLKEYQPHLLVGGAFLVIVLTFVVIALKQDHVVEDSERVIDKHVYQRVYTNGKTHLVDDPMCPECRKITESIVDSMLRARDIY